MALTTPKEIDEMIELGLLTSEEGDELRKKYEAAAGMPENSEANEASVLENLDDLPEDPPVVAEKPAKVARAKKESKTPKAEKTPKAPKESKPKEEKSVVATAAAGAASVIRRKIKNGDMAGYIRQIASDKIDVGNGFLTPSDLIEAVPAVKARDKLVDMLEAAFTKKGLTTYSALAVKHLRDKRSLKAVDFANALMDTPSGKGTGYSQGTARSQSQQMHSVFKALNIIGDDDAINDKSPILAMIAGA